MSIQFAEYCETHKIIPLCLPPHSTHLLQPLDVGIFSPLARAYKKRLYDFAFYGAVNITKPKFLEYYQAARHEAISPTNIASAWRATGLLPFDPSVILQKIQPTAQSTTQPPCISFTDKNGHRFDIPMSPSVEEKLTAIFGQLLQGASPFHSKAIHNIQQFTLRTVADNIILKRTNQELLEKQKKQRHNNTKAAYGKARVLSVAEAQKKNKEKLQKEQEEATAKERRAALRGVITFAKKVWKELPMDYSVFM